MKNEPDKIIVKGAKVHEISKYCIKKQKYCIKIKMAGKM